MDPHTDTHTDTHTAGRRTWLAAGGGAVIGAAAVAAVLAGLGWGPSGGSGSAGGSVTLPDTVSGLRPEGDVVEELRGEPIEGRAEGLVETVELLSASRSGAAAAGQDYADDDLEERFTVWAVADESPALWSPQESEAFAELMALETPMEWVERDGDVECLVYPAQPVLRGRGGEVEMRIRQCQLVQDGVTLVLTGMGDGTISRPAGILRDIADQLDQG